VTDDQLARRFEADRPRLAALAYRMLGSSTEAEDAVQEAWFRLHRNDMDQVDNLSGWLTTVVSRICLDALRARKARPDGPIPAPEASEHPDTGVDIERDAVMADSIGTALVVVLDTLNPAERLAFVLHDLFGLPFDEIAPIVDRSPAAARQLASRARRRVQGRTDGGQVDQERQRSVVEAFLSASREGRFEDLLALLDPEVVLRADATAVAGSEAGRDAGAPILAPEVHGLDAVAAAFSGRARATRPALVDGLFGATWAPGDVPRAVFEFTIVDGRITAIDLVADPETISTIDVRILGA